MDLKYQMSKLIATIKKINNIDNLNINSWVKEDNILSLFNRKTMQIGNYPIFLAGDVNNDVTLLHEASKEGVIAGENASSYPDVKEYKRNVLLSVVFSSPQIMQVGQTMHNEEDVIKGTVSFEDQGRSRVMLKNKGMMNVYFDKKTDVEPKLIVNQPIENMFPYLPEAELKENMVAEKDD
jgi:dihydrolipoamide dehydrogenase